MSGQKKCSEQEVVAQLHAAITSELEQLQTRSTSSGKHSLIIILEDHVSRSSILPELVVCSVAKKIGITDVFTETESNELIDKIKRMQISNSSPNFSYILKMLASMSMRTSSIDSSISDPKERNKNINKRINEQNKPGVVIIGALHALHLLKPSCIGAESLTEKYEVMFINTISQTRRDELYQNPQYPKQLLDIGFHSEIVQLGNDLDLSKSLALAKLNPEFQGDSTALSTLDELIYLSSKSSAIKGISDHVLEHLNDRLKEYPGDISTRLKKADLLAGKSKYKEAALDYNFVLAIYPDNQQAKKELAGIKQILLYSHL